MKWRSMFADDQRWGPDEISGGPLDGADSLCGPMGAYREVWEFGDDVRAVRMPSGAHEAYEYDKLNDVWKYTGRVPQSFIDLKMKIRALPTSGIHKPLVQKLIVGPGAAPKMIVAPGEEDAS